MEKPLAIVTLDNRPNLDWIKISNQSKKDYCNAHGFDFIFESKLYYPERHPVWSKCPCVLAALDKGYPYVMWIDSDAIILNQDFNITTLFDEHAIYYNNDCHGLNFGVFAVKNTVTGRNFIEDVDDAYDCYADRPGREQSAARDIITACYSTVAKCLPGRAWNSYDDVYNCALDNVYQDGDFILHLPNGAFLNRLKENYRYKRFCELVSRDVAQSG